MASDLFSNQIQERLGLVTLALSLVLKNFGGQSLISNKVNRSAYVKATRQ
jgi:hypothetical protein